MGKNKGQAFDVMRTRIDPTYARQLLLNTNKNNRPLNAQHVKRLAAAMTAGHWKFNGDTITLSGDRLIDGQHRLAACAESGVTIEVILVKGVNADVFDTKDVGKKRNPADTFSIRGEHNCATLGAALQLLHHYLTVQCRSQRAAYPITVLEEVLEQHPGIRRSVSLVSSQKVKFIPGSALSALHYLFSQKDTVLADAFLEALTSGTNLAEIDPIYVLRERLLNNMVAKGKVPTLYLMAVTVKAWNAMRKGRTIRNLGWRGGEESPEDFPVIE
jgi:hypothetical protein